MKRLEVKYVRDFCKSDYDKAAECYICGTDKELQLHHYNSLTLLWEKWKKENEIQIKDVKDIEKYREVFKNKFSNEIYREVVTLCKFHHMDRLHVIYGKVPPLHTVNKQKQWCETQRLKEKQKWQLDLSRSIR